MIAQTWPTLLVYTRLSSPEVAARVFKHQGLESSLYATNTA